MATYRRDVEEFEQKRRKVMKGSFARCACRRSSQARVAGGQSMSLVGRREGFARNVADLFEGRKSECILLSSAGSPDQGPSALLCEQSRVGPSCGPRSLKEAHPWVNHRREVSPESSLQTATRCGLVWASSTASPRRRLQRQAE